VGLLDSFEKGLERAVNGAFAKTFRSGIQPVEIASALRRELDTKAAVVSRDRILAPNTFGVELAPDDFTKMSALGATLIDELDTLVQTHAKAQGYTFAGAVTITLSADPQLSAGTLRVASRTEEGRVSWRAVVDIDGTRHPLRASRTVIAIPDPGTSRKHVEILWDGERAMVRDLGSTNGTTLDGRRVIEAPLAPDSVVRIGRTEIVFHVVAQARAERPPVPPLPDLTQAYDTRRGDGRA
jgi:pSer/pThr/pTyr-binding forkhead associated (FHA) protein